MIADRLKEMVDYVYYQLSSQEQCVFDYSSESHDKPKLSVNAIAKKVGISTSKVYRIRRKIDYKIYSCCLN